MNRQLQFVLYIGALLLAAQAAQAAQITFYEGEGFRGRAFTTKRAMPSFQGTGINDRASSVVVDSGDWLVCDGAEFRGRCVFLRRGAYDSLRGMGLDNRISSVRLADRGRGEYSEAPTRLDEPNYEYRRRPYEPVDEARVTSVRAVMRDRDRHCWIEREQVDDDRRDPKVGGAVAGAIIGGIIGHQIGRGRGNKAATAGGAVAGAAVGANAARDRDRDRDDDDRYADERDVRHCESRGDREAEYWDVTYEYRNVEHYVRMTAPPGRTILVNRNGEPRQ